MTKRKRCTKCRRVKPVTAFYRDSKNHDRPRGQCKKCQGDAALAWRDRNPDKYKSGSARANLAAHVRRRFGITLEEYEARRAECDGLCKICRQPESRPRGLSLDHNHKTKVIRDWLCSRCNLLIASEDPELLENAAAYLRQHSLVFVESSPIVSPFDEVE